MTGIKNNDHEARLERVRETAVAFREAVRELIDTSPVQDVERVFDRVYPQQASMHVRQARLQMFNGVTSLLGAELRAEQMRIVAKAGNS